MSRPVLAERAPFTVQNGPFHNRPVTNSTWVILQSELVPMFHIILSRGSKCKNFKCCRTVERR